MDKKLKVAVFEDIYLFRFLASVAIKLGLGTVVFSSYFLFYLGEKDSVIFSIGLILGFIVFIIGAIGRFSVTKPKV